MCLCQIRSDEQYKSRVTYSLTGIGADQNPANLFTVNPDKGLVRINGILDREKIASYHVSYPLKSNPRRGMLVLKM